MRMQSNLDLRQPLLSHSILLVDQLYMKTYQYLSITLDAILCYSFLKIVLAVILISVPNLGSSLQLLWVILLIPISFLQLIYNCKVKCLLKNKTLFLGMAEKFGHAMYFPFAEVSATEMQTNVHDQICDFTNRALVQLHRSDIRIYSFELKYYVLKENSFTDIGGKLIFLFYTILHIYGFIIVSYSLKNASVASVSILCVLIFSTYQYLQIYLCFAFLILTIPIYLIFMGIKKIKNSRHRSNLALNLNSVVFDPLSLRGDHSCHICLQDYQQGEVLSILNCNPMHHFHRTCLTEWLQLGQKCPLCRSDIIF